MTMMTPMHIIVLLILMVPVATLAKDDDFVRTDFRPYKQTWDIFKKDFSRLYNQYEEIRRFIVFMENVKQIERHNQDYLKNKVSYTMGINQFTDKMKDEEVYNCHVGDDDEEDTEQLHHRLRRQILGFCERYRPTSKAATPRSLDWRDKEVVTCVGDQGQCGSCYSFGVTTTIAAQLKLKAKKKLTALSEQQLVDCFRGCNGSHAEASFQYIKESGGIMSLNDYPYRRQTHKQGRPGPCEFNETKAVAKVTGCKYSQNSETTLKLMVATEGPVYVRISVLPSFEKYEKGVYSASNCASLSGHCVTVIGYGTDPKSKKDYWIVKNSWGPAWGIGGYGWIERGVNMCGIARRCTIPVVDPGPNAVSSATMLSKNDSRFLSTVLSIFLVFYSLIG